MIDVHRHNPYRCGNSLCQQQPITQVKVSPNGLEAVGMLPTELARQLGVPAIRLTQIINGKRVITSDSTLQLAHWFSDSQQFWINLQAL